MQAPSNNASSNLYIGMISGTSRDGADVALVSFEDEQPELIASACYPYPQELADALGNAIETGQRPSNDVLAELDWKLGELFAACVHKLTHEHDVHYQRIRAIGSHGQTAWHEPPESIQLGNPQLIAKKTGILTVADFRRADLEAEGEGAPLAPLLHRAIFKPESGRRAILNLGGIANLSLVSASGSVRGFDTGPANCLLDAWIKRCHGKAYDEGGQWAASGNVIQPLLMTMMEDPWFSRLPPKSTGVEYFNMHWLERFAELVDFEAADIQSTLAELTVESIVDVLPPDISEVFICGGGVHNTDLLNRLRKQRPDCSIESTAALGVDPDCVEATLFAWLAKERLQEREQDTTSITGATKPVLLGSIHHPV